MQEEEEEDTTEEEVKDGGKEGGGADEDTQQKSFGGSHSRGASRLRGGRPGAQRMRVNGRGYTGKHK